MDHIKGAGPQGSQLTADLSNNATGLIDVDTDFSNMDTIFTNVDITNDFMFSYVMRQPEICIELLEYLFPGHKINKVRYLEADDNTEADIAVEVTDEGIKTSPATQKTITAAYGKKGVRLDVYLDDGKTIYNVEMQTTSVKNLPKRSRYYMGEIDANQILRGQEYDQLKPTYIIFICKFDPFGKNQYRYTFRKMCDEVAGLELGDEAYHVFFNTSGHEGEISDKLKELLKYMDNTKVYPVKRTQYDLIRKIDAAVGEAKMDDEWRREFMTYQVKQRDAEMRGEERKAKETAKNLYEMGLSLEQIAQGVKYPVEIIKKWLGLVTA